MIKREKSMDQFDDSLQSQGGFKTPMKRADQAHAATGRKASIDQPYTNRNKDIFGRSYNNAPVGSVRHI